MPDLLVLADALERCADTATLVPWDTDPPHTTMHVITAAYTVTGDPVARADAAGIIAAAPVLARTLASVVRAVDAAHPRRLYCGGHAPSRLYPCPEVAAILAAVEPLRALLPGGLHD